MMASATVVMMREEPGEPRTRKSLPSFRTMVGVIEESGRLPGPMEFAAPWIRPSPLGAPGFRGEIVHFVVEEEAQTCRR